MDVTRREYASGGTMGGKVRGETIVENGRPVRVMELSVEKAPIIDDERATHAVIDAFEPNYTTNYVLVFGEQILEVMAKPKNLQNLDRMWTTPCIYRGDVN